jgi:hypothetical protein
MKTKLFYIIFLYTIILLAIFNSLLKYRTKQEFPYSNSNQNRHDKWIVVTSINDPADQIKFLANIDQFQLLVVADKKTNQSWHWKNVIFLSLETQEKLNYKIVRTTPFNSYTRKNIGYLYAIQNGAKFIYDTDDNNLPIVNLNEYFNFNDYDYGLIVDANDKQISAASTRVLNPYAHFGQPLIYGHEDIH